MNEDQFLHWLHQIFATREKEIDCDRLQSLLPAYVDVEVSGSGALGAEEYFTLVRAHLEQCPDCDEEYRGLRTVMRLAAEDRLPTVDESLTHFDPKPESTYETA